MTSRHRVAGRPGRRRVAALLLAVVALLLAAGPVPAAVAVTPAAVNGSGSSYVGLAMQEWVANGQTNGLKVNYTPTGSPQGLQSFGQSLIDFAGTEAEFSSLQSSGGEAARGYQYVPDVAGAVAVMYNADDAAGRKVDYLHLSRRTVARIFMGDISRWSDPAISADNVLPNGTQLQLPDQPITVVYRGGQSGTTALFYDFVATVAPDIFGPWAARNQLPTNVRIIQLDSSPTFAPKTQAFNGSDQIAQYVASGSGKWSIAYDEFGYAQTYHAPAAWIQNASGKWIQPYAANISAALEGAKLRPDLSQELSGVYNSANPAAYPISAYSYLVTQCAAAADRPTCKGAYSNPGVTETMAQWMRYIACEGQVNMGEIGYSPLPTNLSQEIVNSIARMRGDGAAPEQLTAANCANPRFRGETGGPSAPADPIIPDSGGGGGGGSGSGDGGGATNESAAAATATPVAAEVDPNASAGGGSTKWQEPAPVAYVRPLQSVPVLVPLVFLLALIIGPPALWGRWRRRRGVNG